MASTVHPATILTGTGSLGYLSERYHVKKALQSLWPTLVFIPFASEGGENAWLTIPVRRGRKVVFYRLPVPTADVTALGESANDPSPKEISASVVSTDTSEYANDVIVTDWSEDTLIRSAVGVATENMTEMAALSFNQLIYNAITANGTAKFARLSADSNKVSANTVMDTCKLTKRGLEELELYLHATKVRPYRDGLYKYAAAPACIKDIRGEATAVIGWADWLIQSHKASEDEVRGWEVGSMAGFKVVETTELNSIISAAMSGGGATSFAYYNVWGGYESVGAVSLAGANLPMPPKGAVTPKLKEMSAWRPERANIQIIKKPPGSAGIHDPLNRRGYVGYKFATAIKVLLSSACGYHLCGSKNSPSGVANGA